MKVLPYASGDNEISSSLVDEREGKKKHFDEFLSAWHKRKTETNPFCQLNLRRGRVPCGQ